LAELSLQSDTILLAAHQHLPISMSSPFPGMIVESSKEEKERN